MKMRSSTAVLAGTIAMLLCMAATPPARAEFGFSIFGSYWEPDDTSDAGGGGLELAFPLSQRWDLDLRGSYFEELDPEPLDVLFDADSPFRNAGLEVLPIELGLRFALAPNAEVVRPYLGGGAGYYLLDSDFGDVDDEGGWYGLFGLGFGDREGASFFVEAQYRKMEATVEEDPDHPFDFEGFDDRVVLDLDGLGFNAGVTWRM
jgi:Outer membrane protein beta-barrel domain